MRAIAAPIDQVEPATVLKKLQHVVVAGVRQLLDQVPPGCGPWIQTQQGAKSVMTVDHPERSVPAADQGDRLASQVIEMLLLVFLGEILLSGPDLSQTDAPLGGV